MPRHNPNIPASLDDLFDLPPERKRTARWLRVSDEKQVEKYGIDAQREMIDRVTERYGLLDTGLVYELPGVSASETDASGFAKIASDARFQDMLGRAGKEYDILIVGYVSRATRNTELDGMTRRTLHKAGAVMLACKERLLSSEPEWMSAAADAAIYTARQGTLISEGNAAKWRKYSDPPGHAPLGYARPEDEPYLLQIDPDVMPEAVQLFERYALGTMSMDDLATDAPFVRRGRYEGRPMTREGIADLLSNPIYRGETSYLRKTAERPDLRAVSDDLWYRVQEVMRDKASGGGPRRTDRIDKLAGLVYCKDDGASIGLDGFDGHGNWRRRHKNPCESWGPMVQSKSRTKETRRKRKERRKASTYSAPVEAAFEQIRLDAATIANVRAIRTRPAHVPDNLNARRIDRKMDEVVEKMRKGLLDRLEAVTRLETLQKAKDDLSTSPVASHGPSPDQAEAMLRAWASTWTSAGERERADLIHALIERIDVRGEAIVGVTLTSDAYEHGFALALPEKVAMACPRGLEPPTFRSAT
jgi:hypothetical protein